jgi:group I intron endonuclease
MTSNTKSTSTERCKALIREYKRTPKDMGVYAIRNTSNGKIYVAASRDIRARINRHRMNLKTNTEQVELLQQDWNACGAEVFEFETLELLEPLDDPTYDPTEDLEILQQLWLEKLSPFDEAGYNTRPPIAH